MKSLYASTLMLFGAWSLFVSQLGWSGHFPTVHGLLQNGQDLSRQWSRRVSPPRKKGSLLGPRKVGRKPDPGKAVRYTWHRVRGKSVHVVRVNLAHPRVRVRLQLAKGRLGQAESFRTMIHRSNPLAAISGAFFSLQNLHPVGNLGANGQLITQAPRQQPGTTLTLSGHNQVEISRGQAISLSYILNQGKEWREKPARNHILGINTPLEMRMARDTIKVYTPHYGRLVDIGPFGRAVVVEDGRVAMRVSGPRVVIPHNGFVLAGIGKSVFTKIERMYEGEAVRLAYWDIRRRRFISPKSLMVGAGPKLLSRGQVIVDARSEGFRHSHIYGTMSRAAVGLTRNGRTMLLVTIPGGAGLQEEALILKELGCWEAMNLDGGASTALYVLGRYPTTPTRELTNLLTITLDRPLPLHPQRPARFPRQ